MGPVLRAIDDDRGRFGHLQRELVSVLWSLTEKDKGINVCFWETDNLPLP